MSEIAAVLIVLSLVIGLGLLVLCVGLGQRCLLPTWFATWLDRMPGWRQRLVSLLGTLSALWTGAYFVGLALSGAWGHPVWAVTSVFEAQNLAQASGPVRGLLMAIAFFFGLLLLALGVFLARGILSPKGLVARLQILPDWLQKDAAFLTVVSVFYTGTYAIFLGLAGILMTGARLAMH
jgi:hypothetical protein